MLPDDHRDDQDDLLDDQDDDTICREAREDLRNDEPPAMDTKSLNQVSFSPAAEEKIRQHARSIGQNRIQQAMSIASSSSPFPCDLPERKRTGNSTGQPRTSNSTGRPRTSNSTGRLRPAFDCNVNSSLSVSSLTRSSRTSITLKRRPGTRDGTPLHQRPVFSGSSKKTIPRTLYLDEGSVHTKSTKSRSKLSPFETDSLYQKLSSCDTFASSKRMTQSPGRRVPPRRSLYELSKTEKKARSEDGKRNRMTTSDFFERMSKDQTFSSLSKTRIDGLPTDKVSEEYY